MAVPTFLCIGAQKAGTTWLASLVSQHPEVCVGVRKELHFFDHPEALARGLDWYEAQFPCDATARAVGEFTPNYLWATTPDGEGGRASKGLAERVAEAYPDLRLIVSLRDPVDRAVSAYYHHIKKGRVHPSQRLPEAARAYPSIVEHGHYAAHLDVWRSLYPADRFLTLVYEDDIRPDAAKAETVRRVFRHLGVDPSFEPAGMTERPNTRGAHFDLRVRHFPPLVAKVMRRAPRAVREMDRWTIPVTDADREALRPLFVPEVARLEALLSRALPWPTARAARATAPASVR